MKTKRRRVKRRLKALVSIAILAVVLLILLFAPFFNISSIEVLGSTRYTPETIRDKAGPLMGENGFRKLRLKAEAILELRLMDSEDRIKELPYVKDCTVSLVFPDKVMIKITERQPEAYIHSLDNYLAVDSDGYVVEATHEKPLGDLKEIKGIEFSKYTLGSRLEASDTELIKTGIGIVNAIKNSDTHSDFKLFDVLDWVDMVDTNDAMFLLDDRITVRFDPQDKLQYTIDFTKEIFFKKINSKESGRLEFSKDQNPSFIPD